MFVYIFGNVEQNVFKLGVAGDPFKQLINIQKSNPYKLAVISSVYVQSKNAAQMIVRLGQQQLGDHEGAGGWFVGLPNELHEQFDNGHFLRSLAAKTGAKLTKRQPRRSQGGSTNLQRLSEVAKVQGLTFEDILEKVEQAYDEGMPIDEVIA